MSIYMDFDIRADIAMKLTRPTQIIINAYDYVLKAFSSLFEAEEKVCAGERATDFDPESKSNPKQYYAFMYGFMGLTKSHACTCAWPERVFKSMAKGKMTKPLLIINPRADKELAKVYETTRQIVKAATPKLQRAIVNAADVLEEYREP